MKIPTKFKIEGKVWSVEMKWQIHFEGQQVLGLTIPDERKILLTHGLPKEDQLRIFIHEVVHAILAEKGLYIAGLSNELEEIIAHGISKEFCDIFQLKFKTQSVK